MSDKAENAAKSDKSELPYENEKNGTTTTTSAAQEPDESNQLYRTLFNTIDVGFAIVEMIFDAAGKPVDYRFIEINPMFEKLTGIDNPQNRLMRELEPEIEDFWIETYGGVALTGESVRFEHFSKTMNR